MKRRINLLVLGLSFHIANGMGGGCAAWHSSTATKHTGEHRHTTFCLVPKQPKTIVTTVTRIRGGDAAYDKDNRIKGDSLFMDMDTFADELHQVRRDIEADTMGSLYRLRRDILLKRNSLKKKKKKKEGPSQKEQAPQKEPQDKESSKEVEEPRVSRDESIAKETETEQPCPAAAKETPTTASNEATSSNEQDEQGAVHKEVVEEIATERNYDEDTLQDAGEIMDETNLDWLVDNEFEEETVREKVDLFEETTTVADFVVGDTDEEENDVLARIVQEDNGLSSIMRKDGDRITARRVDDDSAVEMKETPPEDDWIRTSDNAKEESDEVTVAERQSKEATSRASTTIDSVSILSGGVKTKVKKRRHKQQHHHKRKHPPKRHKKKQLVRPEVDSDDKVKDSILQEALQRQSKNDVSFWKTTGVGLLMVLLWLLVTVILSIVVKATGAKFP